MLKINNNFKKYRILLISAFVVIGGMFLVSYLAYIPTKTFAIDTADPNETRTLMQIDTMQEMSEQICANTKENRTKQLKDTRDGKLYWVAKLKDGNCWMTQNLDFDIPEILHRSTSNVKDADTVTNTIKVDDIADWPSGSTTVNNYNAYYDIGDYVRYNNNLGYISGNPCSNVTSLSDADCTGYFSIANSTSDMHYHVGNYYSYSAVTVGSADNLTSGNAEYDICPKGWKLPTSGSMDNGSFAYLFKQYGLASNANTGTISGVGTDDMPYFAYRSPLYFVYGGSINGGKLANSTYAYYGSSTAHTPYSSNGLYRSLGLHFHNNVFPSFDFWRYMGLSVRCLAIGGWIPGGGYDDEEQPLDSNQANVAITVAPVISIDATSGMSESIDFTQVAEGNITAKVSSNQAYQVLLSTEQSNLEQNPVLANFNIPMVTNDSEITAGVNSWGVKKTLSVAAGGTAGDNTTLTNTLYSPIGIGDDKVLFYKSSGAESKTLVFPVAISVDATLPSGIYSTQVTITAVAN